MLELFKSEFLCPIEFASRYLFANKNQSKYQEIKWIVHITKNYKIIYINVTYINVHNVTVEYIYSFFLHINILCKIERIPIFISRRIYAAKVRKSRKNM